jgi:hypothetical protein
MKSRRAAFRVTGAAWAMALTSVACHHSQPAVLDCTVGGGQGASSLCLKPHQSAAYYADQGNKYFDTLDAKADPHSIPDYSSLVARWEWPPWLKLTAYGHDQTIQLDQVLTREAPSTVPVRDCRGFAVQPFGRCRVSFAYSGGLCPIYEEFTFNDQGEMTFIEAWSDLPGLLPTADAQDRWAEKAGVHRLSTKVPGLGNATGLINLDSPWMQEAAKADLEIADFVARANDFWPNWSQELQNAGNDLYIRGCGWPADAGSAPPDAGAVADAALDAGP